MELSRIIIKNFRSIKAAEIRFDHNCLILLGKNEAGKSNILKAIAAVFDQYMVGDKDRRKRIDNEKIEDYQVIAIYSLAESDFKTIEDKFKSKFKITRDIEFKNGRTLHDYVKIVFREFLRIIDIANGKKARYSYWAYNKADFVLLQKLYIVNGAIETLPGGVALDLQKEVFSIITEMFEENSHKCNFWQYSEEHILPSRVDSEEFIATPEMIKGLENIFILCKRENIKKEFADALSQDGDYANLLEQVSKEITTTFQEIWPDFKGTSIHLQPNGDEILIKIANKAKYSCEDRSDGFKKFISILLMLSTQARANKIRENDLILIDEPDQSLYPTSAQYLKEELLEISKKAKVMYATHSQYMIDSTCIERHLIVEKTDDITTIRKEDCNSPFSHDELLRRAIGTSIFECLQPVNIIFEGWLDKEIFNKHCTAKKITKEFNAYGKVYLGGISGVETLVQLLILANKKFVIVSDSDQTSNNKRMEFERNYPKFKNSWFSYADICAGVITMEDFIETDHIESVLTKNGYASYVYNAKKSAIENIEKAVGNNKEEKQTIKNKIIASLPKGKIKTEYETFIEKLKEKLDAM